MYKWHNSNFDTGILRRRPNSQMHFARTQKIFNPDAKYIDEEFEGKRI